MELGTASADPGELSRGYWDVTDLPTGGSERLPVVLVNGRADGPTAWVTAGVHGDEVTGLAAAQDVVDALNPTAVAGSVVCLPCLNPAGLRRTARTSYYHDEDPNRQFPDPDRDRSRPPKVQERIAERVFVAFCGDRDPALAADLLLDLHTAQVGSLPFTIRDRVLYDAPEDGGGDDEDDGTDDHDAGWESLDDGDDGDDGGDDAHGAADEAMDAESAPPGRTEDDARVLGGDVARLCEAVALPVVTEYEPDEYTDQGLQRSVAGAALNAAGIPACTVELGSPTVVEEDVRAAGVAGVLRALAEWGLVDPVPRSVAEADPGFEAPVDYPVRRYSGPHTDHAGVVRHRLAPGDTVREGEAVADLVEPTGEHLETVDADHDGYVLARLRGVAAYEGDPLYSMAVRDDAPLVAPRE